MTKQQENKSPSVRGNELEQLMTLSNELQLDMSTDISSLMNRGIQKSNTALRLVVEAGLDFLQVKYLVQHGEFEKMIDLAGASSQRVSEAMSLAKFCSRLEIKERHNMLAMSKTKALLLARVDQSVINELLEETDSETITNLESLSYKEMRERIRKLESENADHQVEQETKDLTIKTLNDRASQRRNFNAEYPDFVNVTRDESNALSTEVALRLDELERLVNELDELPAVTDQKMTSLAVTNLQIHLKATAARACQISEKLSATFGDLVTELSGEHLMSTTEIDQAIRDRNTMIQETEQQKRIREDRREAAKPRKPGRPKNS